MSILALEVVLLAEVVTIIYIIGGILEGSNTIETLAKSIF